MTVPLPAASDASSTAATVRIAVIGAGASGISAIKQLVEAFERDDVKAQGKRLDVVGFEKGREVGGVWYVDEDKVKGKTKAYHHFVRKGDEGSVSNLGDSLVIYPKADDEGEEASPMYDNLRTNLPHDVMSFRDLPSPSQDPLAPIVDYSYQSSGSSSPLKPDSIPSSTNSSLPSTPTTTTFTSLFPPRREIQSYLERYARQFDLYRYIRFRTAVTRVYLTDRTSATKDVKKWTIHSRRVGHQDEQEDVVEEFDHVCVANGHYADAWTPEVPGLSSFTGQMLHSRYYNSPRPFSGKKVLVVGSFASGGDIARLMAVWNEQHSSCAYRHDCPDEKETPISNGGSSPPLPLDIHVSCSSLTLYSTPKDDPDQPWGKWITYHPLVSHIHDGTVHFQDGSSEEQVDVILFATGYVYAYPFFKRKDAPWNGSAGLSGTSLVKSTITQADKGEQAAWEIGGIKGQGVTVEALDDLLMFKRDDRTIAFTGLPYQVAPFPFVECQARLIALYWSGAISLAPVGHPSLRLAPNPSNPFSSITSSPLVPDESEEMNGMLQQLAKQEKPQLSGSASKRQQLVFNAPFEFEYQDHLMRLMREAGSGIEGKKLEPWWEKCEGWRRERRADKGLRKRILGF